jgi:hypothetical protein
LLVLEETVRLVDRKGKGKGKEGEEMASGTGQF